MKEELNIAAILKDKPNAKLWSPIVGSCIFKGISSKNGAIIASFIDKDGEQLDWDFNEYGRTLSAPKEAEVCLFPSKQMQDWSKFTWKKGDVLVEEATGKFLFFYQFTNDNYTAFSARYELGKDFRMKDDEDVIYNTKDCHAASEHDAQIACQKLHESLSPNDAFLKYIRKQPEFKDGDVVVHEESHCIYLLEKWDYITNRIFYHARLDTHSSIGLEYSLANDYLEYPFIRSATDSEKQQLFDALAKEGKKWNPDTLQLEDLPKKCEFNAFDKVLVRVGERAKWNMALFIEESKYECDRLCPYRVFNIEEISNKSYGQCIPYNDQTKHLLGTTDEWKGGEE